MPKPTPPSRGFHGWKVVAAGAVMQSLAAGLFVNSFGNYAVFLERQYGWSKTTLSSAFSSTRLVGGLTAPAQGWALDRYGPARIIRAGIVVMALGLVCFSLIQNRLHFFASLFVLTIGAAMCGFLSVTTAVVRWFERKRARALAFGSMGFAIGGAAAPGVVFVIERVGWRWALVISAAVTLAVGWPLTGIFAGGPDDRGSFVDGIHPHDAQMDTTERAEGVSAFHYTARQAVRTRAFWMISLGHGSALLVVAAVIAHLSLYLTGEQGYTVQQASLIGGAVPFFQLVGMLLGGVLGDRMNKRLLASVAMLGHMTGLLLLTYASNLLMILAFIPLHGLAWGVRGPLMQALRADYFGSTYFGQIMGFSALIVMFGSVGGPLIAGTLADRTGSYQLGFTIIAVTAGLGLLFFVLATPPERDDDLALEDRFNPAYPIA